MKIYQKQREKWYYYTTSGELISWEDYNVWWIFGVMVWYKMIIGWYK